jgi:hypothetical protein
MTSAGEQRRSREVCCPDRRHPFVIAWSSPLATSGMSGAFTSSRDSRGWSWAWRPQPPAPLIGGPCSKSGGRGSRPAWALVQALASPLAAPADGFIGVSGHGSLPTPASSGIPVSTKQVVPNTWWHPLPRSGSVWRPQPPGFPAVVLIGLGRRGWLACACGGAPGGQWKTRPDRSLLRRARHHWLRHVTTKLRDSPPAGPDQAVRLLGLFFVGPGRLVPLPTRQNRFLGTSQSSAAAAADRRVRTATAIASLRGAGITASEVMPGSALLPLAAGLPEVVAAAPTPGCCLGRDSPDLPQLVGGVPSHRNRAQWSEKTSASCRGRAPPSILPSIPSAEWMHQGPARHLAPPPLPQADGTALCN